MKEIFIKKEVEKNYLKRYKKISYILLFLLFFTSVFSFLDGFIYPYPDSLRPAVSFYQLISLITLLSALASFFLIFFKKNFVLARYIIAFSLMLYIGVTAILTGNQTDMDLIHVLVLTASPFILFSLEERKHFLIVAFLAFVNIVAVKVFTSTTMSLLALPEDVASSARESTWFLSLLLGTYMSYSIFQNEKNQKTAIEQKARAHNLLFNILPMSIAEKLEKDKRMFIAQKHEEVSVLFTDLSGFTAWCNGKDADQIVHTLDRIVRQFDKLVKKYKGEKIKTIGDGYMAAWGVPDKRQNHFFEALSCGSEMIDFLKKDSLFKEDNVSLRVGIHSGVVTAGVIGEDKFSYDLWGDTVNIASRMESNSELMKITVSCKTISLLKKDPKFQKNFNFKNLGKIKIKGKGEMEVWQVNKKTKK